MEHPENFALSIEQGLKKIKRERNHRGSTLFFSLHYRSLLGIVYRKYHPNRPRSHTRVSGFQTVRRSQGLSSNCLRGRIR